MVEVIIMFFTFIVNIVKWYLFTILPVLILISIFCVLLGMCIRSGLKGGMAVGIIILTMIIFIFVVYGKDSIKIYTKIKGKLVETYFSGKAIFTNTSNKKDNAEQN